MTHSAIEFDSAKADHGLRAGETWSALVRLLLLVGCSYRPETVSPPITDGIGFAPVDACGGRACKHATPMIYGIMIPSVGEHH